MTLRNTICPINKDMTSRDCYETTLFSNVTRVTRKWYGKWLLKASLCSHSGYILVFVSKCYILSILLPDFNANCFLFFLLYTISIKSNYDPVCILRTFYLKIDVSAINETPLGKLLSQTRVFTELWMGNDMTQMVLKVVSLVILCRYCGMKLLRNTKGF